MSDAQIFDIGKPCKHGHTCGRYVVSRKCVQCAIDAAKKWNDANRDRHRAGCRRYNAKHRDEKAAYLKEYRATKYDQVIRANKAWNAANWDKYLAISRRWKSRNRGHVVAIANKRRCSKISRTPQWLTADDHWMMREAYRLSALRKKLTGFAWHVDHIVPLQGNEVSGLHVPWNLQVIPGAVNVRKGNRLIHV